NGKFIFEKSEWPFFLGWFGNELHFPAPMLMFYLAKGSEFFGGLLLCLGLFSRVAASFIAFTMLVATLTANRNEIYNGDGAITISFFFLATVFILFGSGHWSLYHFLNKRKEKHKIKAIANVAKKVF
ncbi:MAG TPA: DoxX family membrane protein, partial [Puia sp.]|nr:DoxX family membrane protein [Puia sp.]